MNKNRVRVKIYGEEFTIKGSSDTSYLKKVAGYVDEKMRFISELNPNLGHQKVTVLTCLNLADEVLRLEEKLRVQERNQTKKVKRKVPNKRRD